MENILIVTADGSETDALLMHKAASVGDEVPAKATGLIYDRSIKLADGEEEAQTAVVGQITLFGKQTDRPARALVQCCDIAVAREAVDAVIEKLDLQDQMDFELNARITYAEWAGRDRFRILPNTARRPLSPIDAQEQVVADLMACPLSALDGKSLSEVKDSPEHRNIVGSIAVHAALWGRLCLTPETVRKLFADLNITLPAKDASSAALSCLKSIAVDAEKLGDDDLAEVTYEALEMGHPALIHDCSKQILSRDSLAERYDLRFVAAQASLRNATTADEAEKLLDVTIECLDKLGGEVGQAILQKLSLLAENGRDEEARNLMKESMEKYPNDPSLMAFIQQVMAGSQQPVPAGAPPQQSGSNLVLPGSEPQAPQGGESKLWIPGS
jgi:hypothetical protein